MYPGLLKSTGNLAAIEPATIIVSPIAAVAVAVGDIVQFDLTSSNSTYTLASALEDYDNKKCPFNVVIAGTAVSNGKECGIWGVVTEGAAAGARCKVCVHGVVSAYVEGTTDVAAGDGLIPGANADLVKASSGANPVVAVALAAQAADSAVLIKVLFNGYQFGSSAA
jgi:hypothetical protein